MVAGSRGSRVESPIVALDRAVRGESEPPTEAEINRVLRTVKEQDNWEVASQGVVGLRLVGGPRPSDQVQEISLKVDPKHGELGRVSHS